MTLAVAADAVMRLVCDTARPHAMPVSLAWPSPPPSFPPPHHRHRPAAPTGVRPSGTIQDWWLEEHGLIMEQPDFPVPAGGYLVTGGRDTTAVLTVWSYFIYFI